MFEGSMDEQEIEELKRSELHCWAYTVMRDESGPGRRARHARDIADAALDVPTFMRLRDRRRTAQLVALAQLWEQRADAWATSRLQWIAPRGDA